MLDFAFHIADGGLCFAQAFICLITLFMEYLTLKNGVKMPFVGFGTFQITGKEECEKSVISAIDAGYRLIDTAQAYGNEEYVGNAIKNCGTPRAELFITQSCGSEITKEPMRQEHLPNHSKNYSLIMWIWCFFTGLTAMFMMRGGRLNVFTKPEKSEQSEFQTLTLTE